MPEHRDLGRTRHCLAEQLQRFRTKIRQVQENTRDVTAGMGKAGGPAICDGIRLQVHRDDRNGSRNFSRRADSCGSHRADRLNALTDEIGRHGGQLIELFVRDACHDLGISSRGETGRSKPFPERCYSIGDGDRLSRMQKAYAPFSRLRDCFERQC